MWFQHCGTPLHLWCQMCDWLNIPFLDKWINHWNLASSDLYILCTWKLTLIRLSWILCVFLIRQHTIGSSLYSLFTGDEVQKLTIPSAWNFILSPVSFESSINCSLSFNKSLLFSILQWKGFSTRWNLASSIIGVCHTRYMTISMCR
jgi:hypothetical protein